LKAENVLIAAAVEIPETLGSQGEYLWEAPITDKELLRAQPIGGHSTVILRDDCNAPSATDAAIAFQ
jgi:hypothetical protein